MYLNMQSLKPRLCKRLEIFDTIEVPQVISTLLKMAAPAGFSYTTLDERGERCALLVNFFSKLPILALLKLLCNLKWK